MEAVLFLVADNAAPDGEKLNIVGIHSAIGAMALPSVYPNVCIVARLKLNSSDWRRSHQVNIQLLDPDRVELFSHSGSFDPVPNPVPSVHLAIYQNLTINVEGLVFTKHGSYQWRLFVDKVRLATTSLDVLVLPSPVA